MKRFEIRQVARWLSLLVAVSNTAVSGTMAPLQLSSETRDLLVAEMRAIADAAGRLHTAVVTGDHGTVVEQASQIRGSFVLEQQLNDRQRHELASLPAGFLDADRGFHQLAARLAEAGRERDSTLERLFLAEMTRACQGCHETFAADRFPGLTGHAAIEPAHGH